MEQSAPAQNLPHRKHGLSQNLMWALGAESATLLASLISLKIISSHFTETQYGKYAGIYGLISFATATCTSWAALVIPQWIVREREDPQTTMHSTITYMVLLSIVGMVVVLGLGALLIHGVSLVSIACLAAADLFGGAAVLALAMLAQSTITVRAGQWVRTSGAMAKAFMLTVLWLLHAVTFTNIGLALLVGQIAVWAVWSVLIAQRIGFFSAPGRPLRHHLSTAATFMVSVGSYAVNEEGDKPLMAASHFSVDAGRYAIAYRMARLAMVPLAAMESATHTQSVERGQRPDEHVHRARKFTMVALAYGVVAVIGLNIFGPIMLRILAKNYQQAITQLRWLSPLVVLRGCRNFSDNGLLGLGQLRTRMMLNVASAVLALTLYVILIPRYSWRGALAATFITEITLVGASWFALHHFQIRENHVLHRASARERKKLAWKY